MCTQSAQNILHTLASTGFFGFVNGFIQVFQPANDIIEKLRFTRQCLVLIFRLVCSLSYRNHLYPVLVCDSKIIFSLPPQLMATQFLLLIVSNDNRLTFTRLKLVLNDIHAYCFHAYTFSVVSLWRLFHPPSLGKHTIPFNLALAIVHSMKRLT